MARLVLGTDKSVRIPAIVKEVQIPMPLSIQKVKDANGKVVGGSTIIDLDGATDVGDYALTYAYYSNMSITGAIDLSSLTTISGRNACQNMFYICRNITSFDLSSLTTISGQYACQNMFYGCTGLTGAIDLSSLTTVSGSNGCDNMFRDCTSITSVDLSSLTTISGKLGCGSMFTYCSFITSVDLSGLTTVSGQQGCSQMFSGCSALTSFTFNNLSNIGSYALYQTFTGCTSLTSLSFPALTSTSFGSYTDQFNRMLNGVTGCTVHFPSNLQSVIGSWSDVTAGFGGTNTTVLFDLPATN